MESVLIILGIGGIVLIGIVLIILAYLGSLLPALPGIPFASAAVFLIHFTLYSYPWYILTVVIVLTVIASFVDYILPIWGTKKYGGSKAGIRGSTIGLIVGALLSFFSGGVGIIALFAGPFLGAYIGERYITKADKTIALRAAWGSLVGFMAGTIGKMAVVTIIAIIFIVGTIKHV